MKRNRPIPLLEAVLTVTLATPLVLPAQEPPVLRATPLAGRIDLDGLLDETAWAGADSIPAFTQTEPRQGEPASGRTVVRVLASADVLIIGVRAEDPDPQGIVSYAKHRDASLANEDHIRLALDTFLDGRSGYIFAVNPGGARFDALIANRGEGENASWDGIWEAATARTATGWSVEIRIPVRSLIFRQGLDTWGFNIERRVQRLQENSRWASPMRDFRIGHVSRAGRLTALPPFSLGVGLSVRPAMTGGFERPEFDASTKHSGDASLDVTQRIGANLLGSVTVNTDFAETEVDTRRTNLTRFPLFFPEKRTFFLEGAEVFDFGLGLGQADIVPFFSRRMGLLAGQEVPILAGAKLNGRVSRTSIGAVVARADELAELTPGATMGVVRVKQDVLAESSLGVLATFGDPEGRAGSWTGGFDFTYQTSRFRGNKNFLVGVWALALDREDLASDRTAAGFKIDYPNDDWDIALTYKRIGDDFQPSLGFVPRPGVHLVNASVNYRHRPTRGPFRTFFYEFQPSAATGLDGEWESYRVFLAPINWRLESGDRFEFNWVPSGERLDEPFEVADSVIIPAGDYHFARWRLEAQFAAKRKLSGQLTWWFGSFYSGSLHEIRLTSAWNPSPILTVEVNAERNVGNLPQGDFTVDLIGTRLKLNLSPDLNLASFVQYDTRSRRFGTNSRVRWTFHPLGDVFLVYNHNLIDRENRWGFDSNQLLIKAQYTLRY